MILLFADVRSRLLRPLADSCVEVYSAASVALLPTPSRSHYTFNFRDVVKVMQVCEQEVLPHCLKAAQCVVSPTWLA
jgi:hypothetical protein